MKQLTLDEKIDQIMVDLAVLKTDVTWLKRIFFGIVITTGAIFGVDMSGVMSA